MSDFAGIYLPEDLTNAIKQGKVVGTLATFSKKCTPHLAPIQHVWVKGQYSLLFALNKDSNTYQNLCWQKEVAFNFMGSPNISYTLYGKAGAVVTPSKNHPVMYIVRMDINKVYDNTYPLSYITSGVKWKYTSEIAKEMHEKFIEEFKRLEEVL